MRGIVGLCAGLCAVSLSASSVPGWNELRPEKIVPMGDNVQAVKLEPGRFSLPADFSVLKTDRASWDFPVRMDLCRKKGLSFDFFCEGMDSIRGFNIYLKSGNGWYTGRFEPPEGSGWRRVVVGQSAFGRTEDKVAGLRSVTALRVTAWRCGKGKVTLGIGNLSILDADAPQVGIVRADSCTADRRYGSERASFAKFFANTLSALEDAGITAVGISDVELDAAAVAGLKLLVFPYNPRLPDGKLKTVEDFVAGGGKLFACHSTDPGIRKILGLDEKRYRTRNFHSSSETPTEEKNGFYLPHVWRYAPEDSSRQAYNLLLRINPDWKAVLDAARQDAERKAREEAAWIARQPSKSGEWRAFWCHSARGLPGKSWEETIRFLKENGFNALLPNLAWGGTAFYRSKVLPVHPTVATEGDAFDDCLAACRKHGVECHVWKVCWRLGRSTDKETEARLRAEGRLQKTAAGKDSGWLCPSRPENLALEIDAFMELAKKGPDGIHFDYIRYADADHCFCAHCRSCFEKQIGRALPDWPKEIRSGTNAVLTAQWRKFRCDNITALVRGVSARARQETPNVKLSAAVFLEAESVPARIGQDWVAWCREGLLDFVCPMDYYGNNFESLVAAQKQMLEGCPVKLRPGLGLSCWKDSRQDAREMTRQIGAVRKVGLDGFTVFNLDSRAVAVLPILHAGPTK